MKASHVTKVVFGCSRWSEDGRRSIGRYRERCGLSRDVPKALVGNRVALLLLKSSCSDKPCAAIIRRLLGEIVQAPVMLGPIFLPKAHFARIRGNAHERHRK